MSWSRRSEARALIATLVTFVTLVTFGTSSVLAAAWSLAAAPVAAVGEGVVASWQDGPVTVEATGRGESLREARKEAIAAALRKVVGEYVEADVVIANDEVVKNEILSFSNAGGVKSEQVGDPEFVGEEVEVTMRVTVDPKPLVARVKGAAKAGAKLDGAALAAEIAAAKDDYEATRKVVQKVFAELPDAFMTIRIVDREGNDTAGFDRSLVQRDRLNGVASVTIPIVLGFDRERWRDNVRPALDQVLEAAADRTIRGVGTWVHDPDDWGQGRFKFSSAPIKAMKWRTSPLQSGRPSNGDVMLCLERDDLGRGRQVTFDGYLLPSDLIPCCSPVQFAGGRTSMVFAGLPARVLQVRLLDGEGGVIDGMDLPLSDLGRFTLPHKPGSTGLAGVEPANPHIGVLTPMFGGSLGRAVDGDFGPILVAPKWLNGKQFATEAVVETSFTLPLDDLELIERIEVELIRPGG